VKFDGRDTDDRSEADEVWISDETPDGVAREDLIWLALTVEAEWLGPKGLTTAEAGMCRVETMHVVNHSNGAEFTRFLCSRTSGL
jgi:hypothetical protein